MTSIYTEDGDILNSNHSPLIFTKKITNEPKLRKIEKEESQCN